MALSEWIEKIGRSIFEAPFGALEISRDAPALAEVRLALLDAVKAKSHRAGGKDVFPYNLVRLRLLGIPEEQAPAVRGSFLAGFLKEELRGGLARANFRFPAELELEVETSPELPGPRGQWLRVDVESRPTPPPAVRVRKTARVLVLQGNAEPRELVLKKTRTNLGRTVNVYRANGPSRRNDLAFSEDDETSRSVSREHAHIVFHAKTGEYRLYNDRWYKAGAAALGSCGLWIIRGGLSSEVPRHGRGVRLESGDEIHLGRAVVQFQWK